MTVPLIPERFGCGLKLSLSELMKIRASLPQLGGVREFRDFSRFYVGPNEYASSIDKIYGIHSNHYDFCRAALLHASADIVCAGALASRADICFEFASSSSPADRIELSQAAFSAAHELGVEVGKCHSTFGPSTAITLAVEGPVLFPFSPMPDDGMVLITRPLGALKQLYLAALGTPTAYLDLAWDMVRASHSRLVRAGHHLISWASDVSGFGLAGALIEAQLATETSIIVAFSDDYWLGGGLNGPPLECLSADLGDAIADWRLPSARSRLICQRELCGPLLVLASSSAAEDLRQLMIDLNLDPKVLGRFTRSPNGGKVEWT